MLLITDTAGRERVICHLHMDVLPLLKRIKNVLNGECWLFDSKAMEVVPFAMLELDTAKEADSA